MTDTPAFVFWGYGSENVFGSFSQFVEAAGHEVIRLPDPDKRRELSSLLGRPFVLLTSAHFTRDGSVLADYYPDIRIGCDLLEIIEHCKPRLSVFYPHDLGTPLVVNEPALLSAFDLVLWPTPFFGYGRRPEHFETVGWTGFTGHYKKAEERQFNAVLLFSDICWHQQNLGIEGTYRKLAPILSCGTPIKFPKWPGVESFESYFSARGATVIPAETPAGELIADARLILSNSLSSISVEAAYMGTPCINLLEDYLPPGAQHDFLAGLPGCVLSRYADAPRRMTTAPAPHRPCVAPFDPHRALECILMGLQARPAHAAEPPFSPTGSTPQIELIAHSGPTTKKRLIRKNSPRQRVLRSPEQTDQPSSGSEAPNIAGDARPSAADPRTAEQQLTTQTAVRLLEGGDPASAFDLLQAVVNEGTTLWEPYFQIAQIASRQNEMGIAEEFLTYACEREVPPGASHRALARLLIESARPEECLAVLSPLLRKGAEDREALELLRKALGNCGELDPIQWARLLVDLRTSGDTSG